MRPFGKEKLVPVALYAVVAIAVPVMALWFASRVSPSFRSALDDAIASSPPVFGVLLLAAMGGAAWVSYVRHGERRTTGTLLQLVLWSSAAAAVLLYGLYLLWRGMLSG